MIYTKLPRSMAGTVIKPAKARERLSSARAWCWDHGHRWWDEDAKAWRTERWDDHDHDTSNTH